MEGLNYENIRMIIVEKQAEYPNAKESCHGILSSLRLVAKIIHRDINKAGLTNNIIGNSGVERKCTRGNANEVRFVCT